MSDTINSGSNVNMFNTDAIAAAVTNSSAGNGAAQTNALGSGFQSQPQKTSRVKTIAELTNVVYNATTITPEGKAFLEDVISGLGIAGVNVKRSTLGDHSSVVCLTYGSTSIGLLFSEAVPLDPQNRIIECRNARVNSLVISDAEEAIRNHNLNSTDVRVLVVYPYDYKNTTVWVNVLANVFKNADSDFVGLESFNGGTVSVNFNTAAVAAYAKAYSINYNLTRGDVSMLIECRNGPKTYQLGIVTGYTNFIRVGTQITPVLHITDVASILMYPSIFVILLSVATYALYNQQMWKLQYRDIHMSSDGKPTGPNIGNLFTNNGELYCATSVSGVDTILNQMPAPAVIFDNIPGRQIIANVDKLFAHGLDKTEANTVLREALMRIVDIKDPNLVLGEFIGNRLAGFFKTNDASSLGNVSDIRNIDFLNVVYRHPQDFRNASSLLEIPENLDIENARLLERASSFVDIVNINQQVTLTPSVINTIINLLGNRVIVNGNNPSANQMYSAMLASSNGWASASQTVSPTVQPAFGFSNFNGLSCV